MTQDLAKLVAVQRKIIAKVYNRIALVVTGIDDDGDRVYFGSSNDADILRDLRREWDDYNILGADLRSSEQEAAVYKARAERAEAALTASEARGLRYREAGDAPMGAVVRFAVPAGDTRQEMRDWLQQDPTGQSLWKQGDCLLVWANEGDLFAAPAQTAHNDDLLFDAWKGIRVLKTVLDKIHGGKGDDVSGALLARIEAAHPEFAPRSAIRPLSPARAALTEADPDAGGGEHG